MSVKLFVDLENVLIEPLTELQELGAQFGGVDRIVLYHPFMSEELWQESRIIQAEVVQPPVRRGKSSADMVLTCDLIEAGLYSRVEWIGLVSGDRDFLPALTLIKRRKPARKLAVICGSRPLSAALRSAQVVDQVIEIELIKPRPDLAFGLIDLLKTKQPPGGFWSQSLLIRYALDPQNGLMPNGDRHVVEAIRALRDQGVLKLTRRHVPDVGMRRVLELTEDLE